MRLNVRINCPYCGGKAVINSRESLSDRVADLYCACKDSRACGATFVFSLSYKHTLNPPTMTTAQMAVALIKNLPQAERDKLRQAELFS